jgi:hypothetical protein
VSFSSLSISYCRVGCGREGDIDGLAVVRARLWPRSTVVGELEKEGAITRRPGGGALWRVRGVLTIGEEELLKQETRHVQQQAIALIITWRVQH